MPLTCSLAIFSKTCRKMRESLNDGIPLLSGIVFLSALKQVRHSFCQSACASNSVLHFSHVFFILFLHPSSFLIMKTRLSSTKLLSNGAGKPQPTAPLVIEVPVWGL